MAEGWQGSLLPAPSPARTGLGVTRAVSPLLLGDAQVPSSGPPVAVGHEVSWAVSPAPRPPQHPSLHLLRLEGAPRAAAQLRPVSRPARWRWRERPGHGHDVRSARCTAGNVTGFEISFVLLPKWKAYSGNILLLWRPFPKNASFPR